MDWMKEIGNCYGVLKKGLPGFSSSHEGLAFVQDGVDRLKSAVYDRVPVREQKLAAIEVAVQALRFLNDVSDE